MFAKIVKMCFLLFAFGSQDHVDQRLQKLQNHCNFSTLANVLKIARLSIFVANLGSGLLVLRKNAFRKNWHFVAFLKMPIIPPKKN
jgi:hypothetical protein